MPVMPEGRYLDLWEVLPCDHCGAPAGQRCRTSAGRIRIPSHLENRIADPLDHQGPNQWKIL